MLHLIRTLAKMPGERKQDGLTIIEIMIALAIAAIALTGAYGLMLAAGKHYRSSVAMTDMYAYSRLAMERLFRDISETSNETVAVKTTNIRSEDGLRDDAISFASARDASGQFQLATYGAFNFMRPVWQKAIIYYLLDDGSGNGKTLYRKVAAKYDWEINYDPTQAMDMEGEIIAWNVDYMYFGPPYPEVDPEITRKDHVLEVSLGLLKSQEDMKVGPARTIELNTSVPMMNRDKK